MVAVNIADGPDFEVTTRLTLFDVPGLFRDGTPFGYPAYDVAPGDQRFLMARLANTPSGAEDEPSGGLILVENFFEELKAKAGN